MLRFVLASVLIVSTASAQQTWLVRPGGPGPGTGTAADPYTSLQYAIDQPTTLAGDIVAVIATLYAENIDLRGKDLHVRSEGPGVPAIDLRVIGGTGFTFRSGETSLCKVEGFRILGGTGTPISGRRFGGGILVDGASPTLVSLQILNAVTESGGGACVLGGQPTFRDIIFQSNEAQAGAGLYVANSGVVLEDCLFDRNAVTAPGTAAYGGGALFLQGGHGVIRRTTFVNNTVFGTGGGGGGGLATLADAGSVRLRDCVLRENEVGFLHGALGAGVLALGPLEAWDTVFERNGRRVLWDVTAGGGASGGHYTRCTFSENRAHSGGALHRATATDSFFLRNTGCLSSTTPSRGGAALECTLIGCTLDQNNCCGDGGAACDSHLVDCQVLRNYGLNGGGLYGGSALRTRLHGNRTSVPNSGSVVASGGGAHSAQLVLCEVSSNMSPLGGGVLGGTADRCSILGNAALASGGVHGTALQNSIVWHNVPLDNGGSSTFEYSNVEGALQPGPGNLSSDPRLQTPSGGDAHLLASSPCIDAASPLAPLDPDGSPADMGSTPFDPTFRLGPTAYCHGTPELEGSTSTLCGVQLEVSGPASLSSGLTITGIGHATASAGILLLGLEPGRAIVPRRTSSGGMRGVNTVCIGGQVLRAGIVPVMSGPTNCEQTITQSLTGADLIGFGAFSGGSIYAQYWFLGSGQFSYPTFTSAIAVPVFP